MIRLIALFLLAPLLGGCLSPAQKLDPSAVAHIKEGTTTRVEIEQEFGKPGEVVIGSNLKTVAEYHYMIASPPSPTLPRSVYLRSLSVLYDRHSIAEKIVHNETSKTIKEGMTGTSIGSAFTTDWIVKGRTTTNAVIHACGPPDFKTFTPEGALVLGWIHVKRLRNLTTTGVEKFMIVADDMGVVRDFTIVARASVVP